MGDVMPSVMQGRTTQVRASEEAALARLMERLTAMFPELSEEQIARTVRGQYSEYEDSRIRDFVPVLVERAARNELKGTPMARHRA
jgi:hypothetical protein